MSNHEIRIWSEKRTILISDELDSSRVSMKLAANEAGVLLYQNGRDTYLFAPGTWSSAEAVEVNND